MGGLDYCIETARDQETEYSEYSERQQIARAAAYLLWCLVTNHPFVDGNKRTAYQTADVFLRANGCKLVLVDPDEAVSILSGVATGRVSLVELSSWFELHMSR
jgi:death-on-curing protein